MMLKCRQVEARASAYLDGDLGWWERRRVELHLAICHACRTYLRQLRVLVSALHRLGDAARAEEAVPAGVPDQIWRAWREGGPGP